MIRALERQTSGLRTREAMNKRLQLHEPQGVSTSGERKRRVAARYLTINGLKMAISIP